ncbi:MAG: hypothetical protein K0S96_196, partial [Geminicoccaceae bacterium]|nr:hypothetical protein [Geminicoccaceae bacterium]
TTDPGGRPVMRFDGVDDSLQVGSPPSLAAGVSVFMTYRLRQHVEGQGIIGAGAAGTGAGANQYFEMVSTSTADSTNLVGHAVQTDSLSTPHRQTARGDKNFVIFTIGVGIAALRDFLGEVVDTYSSTAFGTPDILSIGSRINDQFAVAPFGMLDVYEVGAYTRVLTTPELEQLENYLTSRHQVIWSPAYLSGSGLAWWHDDWSDFALTGALVGQWHDRSGAGRHWTASGTARPSKTTDSGNVVVRCDGVDDVMSMTAPLPALQPFTVAVVYRIRNRVDFDGVLSASTATGLDHVDFWAFETATAASNNMQLFGRSVEVGQQELVLTRADGGVAQIAIWTADAGSATLRDRSGQVTDGYGGSFGTPAAIVLGARYNAGPFNYAEVDVMGTVGVTTALAASDQLKLIDWASAKWGV